MTVHLSITPCCSPAIQIENSNVGALQCDLKKWGESLTHPYWKNASRERQIDDVSDSGK